MQTNTKRMKMLSISKKNQKLLDTIEDFGDEWDTCFSDTMFKATDELYKLRKKLMNNKWAVVRQLVETT